MNDAPSLEMYKLEQSANFNSKFTKDRIIHPTSLQDVHIDYTYGIRPYGVCISFRSTRPMVA
ncbi:MAG TPA: hypothetical protein VGI33_13680, partial [Paenibacillus sp.]